jgi:hypothetical protein
MHKTDSFQAKAEHFGISLLWFPKEQEESANRSIVEFPVVFKQRKKQNGGCFISNTADSVMT